jgi:mannan endo-1,4-beta-mannosidase
MFCQIFYRHRPHAPHRLFVVALLLGALPAQSSTAQSKTEGFIQSHGVQLTLNGHPFRYGGANIYWLGLDENVGGVGYPTHFRVDDAIETAQRMGATVVRAHTLGVSTGNKLSLEPSLGHFNDQAFESIDYAVASASRHGIRLLIPLTDNYHYYSGGKRDFTDWEHVPEDDFFTNPQVIADFEAYLDHLLQHVNPLTGVALKDDPSIFAWETGNEIHPPTTWTSEISAHLKHIDPHHLVLDGHYGVDTAACDLPTVDLCGAHFNGTAFMMTNGALHNQVKLLAGKRPFIIGEFDWQQHHGGGNLENFLKEALANPGVAGATYWSLFGHADTSGYVQHGDGFTLHYPGDTPPMRLRVIALRTFAFHMSSLPVPQEPSPDPPLLTGASHGEVVWRGSAGADTYELSRSVEGPNGPWVILTSNKITDNDLPFHDTTKPPGNIWYRVRAANTEGFLGAYSPVAEVR